MKSILLIIFLSVTNLCFSQDSLHFNHKDIGFGADILNDKYYFPIFLNDKLKIEPEIEFYLRYDDPHANDSKLFEIGSGFFYTLNYGQLIPYFGLRIGYTYFNNKYAENNTHKESGFYMSPTLGGEYFLFERFSLGFELLAKYIHTDGNETYIGGERESKRRGFQTITYFVLRIYLF